MTDQTRLSDEQYARIEPLLPRRGNHVKIAHRQVLDAWLYVYYQGCTWRGLPREFGDWHTIYVRPASLFEHASQMLSCLDRDYSHSELQAYLEITPAQLKAWLPEFLALGVLEQASKRPVRYRTRPPTFQL